MTKFFTDSKVVLGYIYNESKRFYVYVHNRVQRIRQSSRPEQWHYVRTEENPADHASRSLPASCLAQTSWFTGPSFLRQPPAGKTQMTETFELIEPENDSEIRPQVQTCATNLEEPELTSNRFQRFSTFTSLVRGVAFLVHMAKSFKHTTKTANAKVGTDVTYLVLQTKLTKQGMSSLKQHKRLHLQKNCQPSKLTKLYPKVAACGSSVRSWRTISFALEDDLSTLRLQLRKKNNNSSQR